MDSSTFFPGIAPPRWPAGSFFGDHFMFGEPHANYYEGHVFYDDVTLEEWRD